MDKPQEILDLEKSNLVLSLLKLRMKMIFLTIKKVKPIF